MKIFPEMMISATGLTAERLRLEVIARNIANVNTTKAANGEVFRRQLVQLTAMDGNDFPGAPAGVQVMGVVEDASPLKMIYDPGNPEADQSGYVARPNVDVMLEMVDLLGATRAYEANVTVLQNAKEMARLALEI